MLKPKHQTTKNFSQTSWMARAWRIVMNADSARCCAMFIVLGSIGGGNRAERFSMLCIQLLNFSRSPFAAHHSHRSCMRVCARTELVIDFGSYDVPSSMAQMNRLDFPFSFFFRVVCLLVWCPLLLGNEHRATARAQQKSTSFAVLAHQTAIAVCCNLITF